MNAGAHHLEVAVVSGHVLGPDAGPGRRVLLRWFDRDHRPLGTRRVYDGHYAILVPEGQVHLRFVDERPADDPRRCAPVTVSVTATGAQPAYRRIQLARGATVRGLVLTDAGPARNARVALVGAGEAGPGTEVRTDSRGAFLIGGVGPGHHTLVARDARGNCTATAAVAPLQPGEDEGLELRLTAPSGGLTVRLRGTDGDRVAATTVTARHSATGHTEAVRSTDGVARFHALVPGAYDVSVVGTAHHLGRSGTGCPVQAGHVSTCEIAVSPGAALVGLVVAPDGTPAARAVLRLVAADGRLLARARADRDGRFVLGALSAGADLTVEVRPAPATPGVGKLWLTGGSLTTGQVRDLGVLSLPARAARAGRRGPTRATGVRATSAVMSLPAMRV